MISKSPRLIAACGLLALLAACDTQPTPDGADTALASNAGATDRQTAFRLRRDFDAGLNADVGWAAGVNENATVYTDEPFRLRFEVEAADGSQTERRYQLQYRRNNGDWQPMPAENFPQPSKLLQPDLAADPGSAWQILTGSLASITVNSTGEDPYLQFVSGDDDTTVIGRYETFWDAIEFALYVNLPGNEPSSAGVMFGFIDADNFSRVELNSPGTAAPGTIVVDQYVDGEATRLAEVTTEIATDRWTELKIIMEGRQAIVEYDDDAVILTADFSTDIPASVMGLYVPAGASAAFADIAIEGEPASPLVSIMASDSFAHGEQTSDLLAGSSTGFIGGAGVSFTRTTRPWAADSGHSEWEWPLVIRRFADGAQTNENGDTYAFRMVTADGETLMASAAPTVTVAVPPRHIGGVFVETPMRVGPFEASNGDLYFLIEPAETDNMLMTVKSTDGGDSWQEVDGMNRPVTGDLEGFAAVLAEDTIYMLHQTSYDVWLHAFGTADHATRPDAWLIQDELLASPEEPPTQVADIAMRPDGSIVGVYGGPEKIHFRTRSPDGAWSEETVIDADQPQNLSGPAVVSGHDGVVHLAYTGNDGSAWYRRIEADGRLSPRQQLTTELGTEEHDVASILPLVFLPESNTVSIIYRVNTGKLWERRVTADGQLRDAVMVSDYPVVQNAVDSDQTGADAIADGSRVHVLFIDDDSRHIFHTYTDDEGNWQPATLQVDGINAQWVRGARLKGEGEQRVYGYVYDAGADGGSGKNRYAEVPLTGLPGQNR